MRRPYLEHHVSPVSLPEIRRIEAIRPWFWLAEAWRDFSEAPAVSMIYGLAVTLLFDLITLGFGLRGDYHWVVGIMAGFVLVAPVLAVGLYEISRRLEGELEIGLRDTVHGWRHNRSSVLTMGAVLVLLLMSWFMVSMQLAAVLVQKAGLVSAMFASGSDLPTFLFSITWPMVVAFVATGLVTAVVTFLLSALSVPMLMDHDDMDVVSAMVTSVRAVLVNWRPMALWAAIVVGFTAISVIPLYLGLIATFPLLAYATWHGYREIIGD